jgi:hypothetical protein
MRAITAVAVLGLLVVFTNGCDPEDRPDQEIEEPPDGGPAPLQLACTEADCVCTLPECGCRQGSNRVFAPEGDERNSFVAMAVELPTTPFEVREIGYFLAEGDLTGLEPCDPTLPHRVELWVDEEEIPAPPPSAPAVRFAATEEQTAAGRSASADGVPIISDFRVAVDPPVVIAPGERLLVALQRVATVDRVMCPAACFAGGTPLPERAWSGLGTSPPFDWDSLGDMADTAEAWNFSVKGGPPNGR